MNTIIHKFMLAILTAAISVGLSLAAAAQEPPTPMPTSKPKVKITPPSYPAPAAPPAPWKNYHGGETYERSIAVTANVNLNLCVTEGTLKVNGWNRNEVRVYVENGSKFGFKIIDKASDGKAVWIGISSFNQKYGNECIWGEDIEVDVPVGTTLNLSGKSIQATVDTVKRVSVKSAGGDITVRNVKNGVTALTYEGDITLEESSGQISLETTTGNIMVFDAGPTDIGDAFKAKTNGGAISLQRVIHRAIEVSSISGSVYFNGELKSGGTYSLSTTNGTIRLTLPANTGCKLAATFTSGSFASEFPFKVETENVSEGDLKTIVGKIGPGGDAVLKLSTVAGLIGIKKQ
ncbi:MAG TPA: DUF4097 family beta strand repeat-containing protein [Pyrinomonadaceae bacterium]|jgi:hypothetical protein|nr:DUF4097 family beta strand repeat-containing protein [Pyrinomonadaceae bacterium]